MGAQSTRLCERCVSRGGVYCEPFHPRRANETSLCSLTWQDYHVCLSSYEYASYWQCHGSGWWLLWFLLFAVFVLCMVGLSYSLLNYPWNESRDARDALVYAQPPPAGCPPAYPPRGSVSTPAYALRGSVSIPGPGPARPSGAPGPLAAGPWRAPTAGSRRGYRTRLPGTAYCAVCDAWFGEEERLGHNGGRLCHQ